jgi:TRAP-type C4-dicarboxylate transport system permease small subunit
MKRVKRFFEGINGIFQFIIYGTIVLQIVCRNFLRVPVSWTDDWSRVVYMCLVFLGATLALRDEGAHISVDIVIMLLPQRAKQVMKIISCIAMLPIIVVYTIGAFQGMVLYWNSVVNTVKWLTRGELYLYMAVCGCFMFILVIWNTVDAIRIFIQKPLNQPE